MLVSVLGVVACGEAPDSSTAPSPATSPPPIPTEQLLQETHGDNLLLITFDTTRADRLGCYGHSGARTPTLDGLAADGVLFERAMTTTPITLPSHTSVLTGLYPVEHGVRANGLFSASDSLWTLPEALAEDGYTCAAFVSAEVLHARYGLSQGFEHYDDELDSAYEGGASRVERNATRTTDAVLEWMRSEPPEPWFAWVHYFDPHDPLEAPAEIASSVPDPYDAEIAYADDNLGRLLQALERDGQRERTLVCFTADHGESLGDHGELTHGHFLYDSTMRVPLVLSHPALSCRRVDGQVGVVDIFPTCLQLLGLDPHEDLLPGGSLVPALCGHDEEVWHPAYLEALLGYYSNGLAATEALSDRGHKLIIAPRSELYDLVADPDESRNLFDRSPDRVRELRETMIAQRGGRSPEPPVAERALSAAERRMLIQLGYLTPETDATDGAARMDPKDFVHLQEQRGRANALFSAQRLEEAEQILLEVIAAAPKDAPSLGLLGHIQFMTRRPDEAEKNLLRALAARPDQPGAFMDLAKISGNRGDFGSALEHLETAIRYAPSFDAAYDLAIQICEFTKNEAGAADWRRRKAERD